MYLSQGEGKVCMQTLVLVQEELTNEEKKSLYTTKLLERGVIYK
jgi:hypothetical protein